MEVAMCRFLAFITLGWKGSSEATAAGADPPQTLWLASS